jgi:hypothetical protein
LNRPAIVAVAAVLGLLTACGNSSEPTPAAAAVAVPTGPTAEQTFLEDAHAGQWPTPDARLLTIAHSLCTTLSGLSPSPYAADLQVDMLILSEDFTKAQAKSFVYETERAFCPDKTGK